MSLSHKSNATSPKEGTMDIIKHDATEFINGWISGYLAHGGSLSDPDLTDKVMAAYERRIHPPEMPEPVRIKLDEAIRAVAVA